GQRHGIASAADDKRHVRSCELPVRNVESEFVGCIEAAVVDIACDAYDGYEPAEAAAAKPKSLAKRVLIGKETIRQSLIDDGDRRRASRFIVFIERPPSPQRYSQSLEISFAHAQESGDRLMLASVIRPALDAEVFSPILQVRRQSETDGRRLRARKRAYAFEQA